MKHIETLTSPYLESAGIPIFDDHLSRLISLLVSPEHAIAYLTAHGFVRKESSETTVPAYIRNRKNLTEVYSRTDVVEGEKTEVFRQIARYQDRFTTVNKDDWEIWLGLLISEESRGESQAKVINELLVIAGHSALGALILGFDRIIELYGKGWPDLLPVSRPEELVLQKAFDWPGIDK